MVIAYEPVGPWARGGRHAGGGAGGLPGDPHSGRARRSATRLPTPYASLWRQRQARQRGRVHRLGGRGRRPGRRREPAGGRVQAGCAATTTCLRCEHPLGDLVW